MRNYKQLSQEQRYQIGILKKAGKNQKEIAELLGVSPGTICRELNRNKGKRGYRPEQAQIKSDKRRAQAAKALKMTEGLVRLGRRKDCAGLEPRASLRLVKGGARHRC